MHPSIIRRTPLFATLPEEEINALASSLRPCSHPAQTILFEEGECGDRFYIVIEGEIAILKARTTPNERLIGIRTSGEFVGEMSLLNRDGLRTASAVVRTDAKTLEMTREEFDALLNRKPTIAYEMLRVLSTRLNEAHNKTIVELTEKNRRLSEAYENLKTAQEKIIQKEVLERELSRAQEIQKSMLPRTIPRLQAMDLGALMIPARAVGGDLYDILPLDEDTFGIVIGDVSGKGVPAALFMALTQSTIRAISRADRDPAEVLTRLNHHLFEMNAGGMFVTLFYGILNPKNRTLTYIRAAHEYPLLWSQNANLLPIAEDRGLPLGLFPKTIFEKQTLVLPPNSTLILFTDGITEATNPAGEFFGLERLTYAIPMCSETSAAGMCHYLVEKVTAFQEEAPQADDITLVIIKT